MPISHAPDFAEAGRLCTPLAAGFFVTNVSSLLLSPSFPRRLPDIESSTIIESPTIHLGVQHLESLRMTQQQRQSSAVSLTTLLLLKKPPQSM